jgi:uncharacterized protein YecE (DUF72 family)
MDRFRFGLSGFADPHLQRELYGANLSPAEMLTAYSRSFGCLEATFTREPHFLPEQAQWLVDTTPKHVQIIPRFSEYISARARITGYETEFDRWLDATDPILKADSRGPLYLPWMGPKTVASQDQLADLLDRLWSVLPGNHEVAVEFRDASWYNPGVMQMLEEHQAGLVWSTLAGPFPKRLTADFLHIRLTGNHPHVQNEASHIAKAIAERPYDNRPVTVASSKYFEPYGLHVLEEISSLVGSPAHLWHANHEPQSNLLQFAAASQ